jgi:lipopolysaccharide/colanic/teichoic acid biosynthesis glycosyltransferase
MSLRETSIESGGDERLTPLSISPTPREFTHLPIRNAANLPEVRLLSPTPIAVPSLAERPAYDISKRIVDIAGGALLLVVTTPIWLTAAALIKLTSSASVLFIQTRLGKDGAPFPCIKFRTMDPDADDRKVHLLHLNEIDGPMFKMRDDPRITRMGRWLRKLSIDELPQLICVLRGEMSLVGPRPSLPNEVEEFSAENRRRLAVKPGITGLWQVSGRSDLSFEQWMELDLEYVKRRSFWFDLWLMARTVPAVILQRGAC